MTGPTPGVIHNADFRRLWSAQTISQFGTQVSLLALPLVAVALLEATPFAVALLGTVEFLPFILFSLVAGAWVDRLRRRPILILADLLRAIALASIPLAYLADVLTMGQLYVVGFVTGTLTVFFDVAYQSYLPSLVERDQLVDGNVKLETSRTVAQTAGPALGGALIGILTAPIAIVVDAVSYAVSALIVFLIRRPEPVPDRAVDVPGAPRLGLRREVSDGLRYVLRNDYLRGIAASSALANLANNIAMSTFLVYAVRELGMGPAQIGIVLGLGNIGAIVGALSADRARRTLGLGRAIVVSMLIEAPALALIALAPAASPVPFLIVSGVIASFGVVVSNINQRSFRQAITPAAMQGRMNATMRFVVWGTIPVGQLVGGIIATAVSLHAAIWVGAVGSFVAVVPLLISPVRTLRELPAPIDEGPPRETGEPGMADAFDDLGDLQTPMPGHGGPG